MHTYMYMHTDTHTHIVPLLASSPGPTQLSMLHAEKREEPGMRCHVKNVMMMYCDVIKRSQKTGLGKRAILS